MKPSSNRSYPCPIVPIWPLLPPPTPHFDFFKDRSISREPSRRFLQFLARSKALENPLLVIPHGPVLTVGSSLTNLGRHFRVLDDISRTVAPFLSIPSALESPRRELSDEPKDYSDPFSGSLSRLVTTTCSSSLSTTSTTHYPGLILGLFCSDSMPLSPPSFASAPLAVVIPDLGILVKTVL